MKKDILIKARILFKEWEIKQQENALKDATTEVEELLEEIGLIDDDRSYESGVAHHSLYESLKEIDTREVLKFDLNQELLKLNNADGYCQCDSCVANRAGAK